MLKQVFIIFFVLLNTFSAYSADSKYTNQLSTDSEFKDEVSLAYEVYIFQKDSWKKVPTYTALVSDAPNRHAEIWNDWDNSKQLRDTMSYVNFLDDFDGPVKVRVKLLKSKFKKATIRPTTYAIKYEKISSQEIEFSLPSWEQRKVSVEFDGNRYENLFLFPNRPDLTGPNLKDHNLIYFGPGQHEVPTITLTDNQTLFIDHGAFLYTNIIIKGSNVKIAGKGVLSGKRLRHWGGKQWANGHILISVQGQGRALKNLQISDVTIIDSPSWTISVYNVDNVRIENINMICWILNGDGIDLCSVTSAVIKDCFIRTYDDCITLKIRKQANPVSEVKDIHITNNIIWCDYARGIVVGPESGDISMGTAISNCLIEDCIVLESTRGDGDQRSALTISQVPEFEKGSGEIKDITFRNIIIDNLHKTGRPICIEQPQQVSSVMSNIVFQNIYIYDSKGYKNPSLVNSTNNSIRGLVFENIMYNGKKLLKPNKRLRVEGDVEVKFL